MKIIITMNEEGRFNVNVSEGLPLFTAVGALEVAKDILIQGDVEPTTDPEPEDIDKEMQ